MLKDKTVIITGAGKGIGSALALAFAEKGANIVLNYRTEKPDSLLKEIEAKSVKCLAIKADISNFKESNDLVLQSKEAFGSIDVLINNAGITKDGLIIRMSEENFDKVIEINLKGAFNMIRHVSNIMLKQRSGTIINMSSIVGVTGNVGQLNYSASKAGLIGMTKTAAKELAQRGITCNAIAPGFIDTDMTTVLSDDIKEKFLKNIPLGRFGSKEEVASVAIFLAENKYITGQVINVNGGMYM